MINLINLKKLESENEIKDQIKDCKKENKDLKRQIEVLTESKKSDSDWEKNIMNLMIKKLKLGRYLKL